MLEVNCLKKDVSAIYEENASVMMALARSDSHPELLQSCLDKRLERLAASGMKFSTTGLDVQKTIAENTENRKKQLMEVIDSYDEDVRNKIERFLGEVDLHYIAATFPKISPEAIARFLKISAQKCYPVVNGPAKHLHVINMRQDLFQALDKDLKEINDDSDVEHKLLTVGADNWLVWTPIAS
jgi:hypothetical protein